MGNKVLAILLLYWYWYGPYLYQKVLILVLAILFEPRSIQYFSAILLQKFKRLFTLGGRVFSPLRSRLTIEHFEMMLFLRTAAKW